MYQPAAWLVAFAFCGLLGCQGQPFAGDPFGRTTIPPPGTGAAFGSGADPYYRAPPTTSAPLTPIPRGNIAPTGSSSQLIPGTNGWHAPGEAPENTRLVSAAAAQPVSRPPRLQPIPTFGGTTTSNRGGVSVLSNNTSTGAAAPANRVIVIDKTRDGQAVVYLQDTSVSPAAASSSSVSKRVELADVPPARGFRNTTRTSSSPTFQPVKNPAAARFGHADDYTWLKGKLEYSAARRQWKLRYIPIDGATDENGGSVVLPDSPELKRYASGDFVAVQGQLGERDAESREFAPIYRVARIQANR